MGITVKNVCPWTVSFKSKSKERGELFAPFEESDRLTIEEIQYQIEKNNRGFTGVDGFGSHAPFQLVNLEEYNQVFGFEKSKLPEYFNESIFKKMVKMKDETKFKAALEKNILTVADKRRLIYFFAREKGLIDSVPIWMKWAIRAYTGMNIKP